MKRRDFVKTVAASTAMLAAGQAWPSQEDDLLCVGGRLPRRPMGKSGVELSVIGFSGLVARGNTPERVERIVGESIELGVNYFDTAASYGDSEVKLAPALHAHRKDIMLSTKTRKRTREEVAVEFEQSCAILGTDYFDMFLVHGIQHVEKDVDAAFIAGGAMEYLIERKKSGQIRFLGFSAHSTEAAITAMDRYDFDFFYLPVNYAAFYKGEFGPAVLKHAVEKGVPCIGLKALARQNWPDSVPKEQRPAGYWYQPIDSPEEASLALRWALSQPIVSILPPGHEELYRRALELRRDLSPITPEETARLQAMAADQNPLFPR